MELKILDTIITPQKNDWYKIEIKFSNDQELSLYIKESFIVEQYDPNEPVTYSSYSSGEEIIIDE